MVWCTSITFANSDINDINVRLNYDLNKVFLVGFSFLYFVFYY